MEIELSDSAKKEIVKYSKYLAKTTKFDEDKIEKLTTEFEEQLKTNINSSKNEHSDSIFPKKTKFGKGYKMCVDKSKHRVIFYKIDKDENGQKIARIHECPHSTELKKELDKKGIKPLEDSDPKLLLDYITIEKEDKVNNDTLTDEEREEYKKKEEELKERISNRSKKKEENSDNKESKEIEKKEEITHSDKTKNPSEIWKRRPKERGIGLTKSYYNIHNPDSSITPEVYNKLVKDYEKKNESIKNIKCVKSYITESKMVSLIDYLKRMVG